jgi:nucleotide-binding universal stress UspA family protein
MLPFTTILHPTDFSKEAGHAFEVACALARDDRARLVVLHVERPPVATLGGIAGVPPLPPEYGRETLLRELQRIQPTECPLTVEHRLEYGEPADVILAMADELDAGLMVMGTHGRTGLRRLLLGSVAEKVVRAAPCPVLTVRVPMATEVARLSATLETAPA